MSDGFPPTARQETKPEQISSFHCLALLKVPHLNKRMVPAAKEFTPRSRCDPCVQMKGLAMGPRGLREER